MTVLSYIDDFRGVTTDQATSATHFTNLRYLLTKLGLWEVEHKVSPPAQPMVWLGLQFDTVAMTVSLPQDNLAEIQLLAHHWANKPRATLRDLRTLLGKLLYIAQVCPSARLFLNRMLDTLKQCPEQGFFTLSSEFRNDLAWFDRFLPTTDGTFLIHQDDRHLVHLYIDACMSGCGALTVGRDYHTTFPSRVLWDNPLICHLEALNATLAIKLWAPQFVHHQLIHLFCDNQATVTIFQA